jgi:hypothetical protein
MTDENSVPIINPPPNTYRRRASRFNSGAGAPISDQRRCKNRHLLRRAGSTFERRCRAPGWREVNRQESSNRTRTLPGRSRRPTAENYNLTLAAPIGVANRRHRGHPLITIFPASLPTRCSYVVKRTVPWNGTVPTQKKAFAVLGHDIISSNSFLHPEYPPAGALYYRFVAAIKPFHQQIPRQPTAASNRPTILLNGQVPMRARLTTYQ